MVAVKPRWSAKTGGHLQTQDTVFKVGEPILSRPFSDDIVAAYKVSV